MVIIVTVIITLVMVLVFLLSGGSALLQGVKNKLWGLPGNKDTFDLQELELTTDDGPILMGSEGFMGGREPTTTWEPSSTDFAKLGADKIYKAYSEDLKSNVDRAIVESHKQYTEDLDFLATTGASHASARDDFTPPVPFHGLPRSAHYMNVGSGNTARVSQSETPEEVIDIASHNTSGYVL